MKNFLIIALLLLVGSNLMFGQDILDIPPVDGSNNPVLVSTINGDTTATGERVSVNRVYRLERNGVYILTSTLVADYPVHFIAADGEGRPPMIVRGKDAQGSNINPMIKFTSDNETHSFKDIIFQGVDLDRKYYSEWFSGLTFLGDSTSVSFNGVTFNAFTAGASTFGGANNSVYYRDCSWRNGVWPNHPFVGQQQNFGEGELDTLVVTNCTYFNNNSYWLFNTGIAKYVVIEHNTIFTSIVDAIHLKNLVQGNIRSNLFYGYAAYGDTELSRQSKWYENDSSPLSTFSIDELPANSDFTEADRIINLTNNAYFTPQAIADYHAAYDTVTGTVWMNDRMQNMFDDGATWVGLSENDNVEMDPKFADAAMDTWVVDEVAKYCTENREGAVGGWSTSTGYRNYDEHLGNDMLSEVQWPLPESMEITDATLLTAGHDGLPVGNLNWNPTLRAQYVEESILLDSELAAIENKVLPTAQTGQFTASWKVTPTHAPMDGVTGLAKGEVGTFGDMGVLVRMNSSGKVDAYNSSGYEALNDLTYEAGKEYTIDVTVDVIAQMYSVEVTPAGASAVVIGTDYVFRSTTPQESLGYLAMVINELEAWGGVPGSRLNPSFLNDDYTIVTGVEKTDNELPTEFAIEQNYPNPFNPTTVINYSVAEVTDVKIEVFNSLGQKVKTLVNTEQSVGNYSVDWNGTDANNYKVSTGIYFYKINAGHFVETRKMLLMK